VKIETLCVKYSGEYNLWENHEGVLVVLKRLIVVDCCERCQENLTEDKKFICGKNLFTGLRKVTKSSNQLFTSLP
jgi:hypothetical protein